MGGLARGRVGSVAVGDMEAEEKAALWVVYDMSAVASRFEKATQGTSDTVQPLSSDESSATEDAAGALRARLRRRWLMDAAATGAGPSDRQANRAARRGTAASQPFAYASAGRSPLPRSGLGRTRRRRRGNFGGNQSQGRAQRGRRTPALHHRTATAGSAKRSATRLQPSSMRRRGATAVAAAAAAPAGRTVATSVTSPPSPAQSPLRRRRRQLSGGRSPASQHSPVSGGGRRPLQRRRGSARGSGGGSGRRSGFL